MAEPNTRLDIKTVSGRRMTEEELSKYPSRYRSGKPDKFVRDGQTGRMMVYPPKFYRSLTPWDLDGPIGWYVGDPYGCVTYDPNDGGPQVRPRPHWHTGEGFREFLICNQILSERVRPEGAD